MTNQKKTSTRNRNRKPSARPARRGRVARSSRSRRSRPRISKRQAIEVEVIEQEVYVSPGQAIGYFRTADDSDDAIMRLAAGVVAYADLNSMDIRAIWQDSDGDGELKALREMMQMARAGRLRGCTLVIPRVSHLSRDATTACRLMTDLADAGVEIDVIVPDQDDPDLVYRGPVDSV